MNTEPQGLNNALMVSLIISFVLHFSLLQTDVDTIRIDEEIIVPSEEKEIQIPIEFIPTTQTVTARQYSTSEIQAVKNLVSEADDSIVLSKSKLERAGAYSLNRTKTAIHNYLLAVREVIEKHKYVSNPSNYYTIVGNVKISFSISAAGEFSNIRVVESSGDQFLDKSALSAIKSANGSIARTKNTGIKLIKASAVVKYQYGL
jgi:TonB family protein